MRSQKAKYSIRTFRLRMALRLHLQVTYRGLNTPWAAGLCNGTYHQITAGADDMYLPTTDAAGTEIDRCCVTDGNGSSEALGMASSRSLSMPIRSLQITSLAPAARM